MYQSIPSLTIPRATLGDSHVLTAQGSGFRQLSLPGGRGFELEKFPTVLRKMQELFDLFQKTGSSLKTRCSCAVSYQFLQKQ